MLTVAVTCAFSAQFALAQATTWKSDPNHSEVDFAVTHLSISKVHGRFGNVSATIQYDPDDVSKSSVQATIDVSTIDTGVQARDNDIKGANYFDVATFPSATFSSTGVTGSRGKFSVTGNLTLHGVTKPVVLEVEGPMGPLTDSKNKIHCGFSATTKISRTAFGIAPSTATAMLSDDVQLTIEIDAIKQ